LKRELSICEACLAIFEKLKGHKITNTELSIKNYDYKKKCIFCMKLTSQYLEINKKRRK